jgi:hypothetical protein
MLGDNAKPELKTLMQSYGAPMVSYTDAGDLYLGSRLLDNHFSAALPQFEYQALTVHALEKPGA